MRRAFQAQFFWGRDWRTQLMIKLPVFKEKKCSYLYNNFLCWDCATSKTPNCIWNKANFYTNTSFYSDSFQYAKKFSESLINSDLFLHLRKILIFWAMCLKIGFYSSFGLPEPCLIFILSKKKMIFSLAFYWNCLLQLLPWRNLI